MTTTAGTRLGLRNHIDAQRRRSWRRTLGGSDVLPAATLSLQLPQQILRAGIRLAPSLADTTVTSTWWGLRPMTPDERPFVGTVRDGLVVATGHGSEGVILGAGTAQLATSIVMGGPPPFDAAPFDPFRFAG